MEDFNLDTPFFIQADIGQGEQEFFVLPDWDQEKGESSFTILADGIELGVLKCIDQEEWEWQESALTKMEAMAFGLQIDNYYN